MWHEHSQNSLALTESGTLGFAILDLQQGDMRELLFVLQRQMVVGLKDCEKNRCQHIYPIQAKYCTLGEDWGRMRRGWIGLVAVMVQLVSWERDKISHRGWDILSISERSMVYDVSWFQHLEQWLDLHTFPAAAEVQAPVFTVTVVDFVLSR